MQHKKVLILLLFFLLPLFTLFVFPQRVTSTENVYILAGDLIKNFKVSSFNGVPYTSHSKLKVEPGSVWKVDEANVIMVQAYMTPDNEVILYYKVGLTNTFNFYSDISLTQACKSLTPIRDPFQVAYYTHHKVLGGSKYHWVEPEGYIYWTHYDFYAGTDLRTFNDANNRLSGNVDFTFDIAGNLLPSSISSSIATLNKTFDYIAISSATVTKNTFFDLNKGETNIAGITPKPVETPAPQSTITYGKGRMDLVVSFDPKITLIPKVAYETYDGGKQGHTVGTTMNPTTKDGRDIWDPLEQRSMTDGKISYNINVLSPLVTKYTGYLSYTKESYKVQDYEYNLFTGNCKIKVVEHTFDMPMTWYKDTALDVKNRGIQTEVILWLNVYSSYTITPKEVGEVVQVEIPERWFDDLTWLSIVEGYGGGKQYSSAPQPFADLISWFLSNIWSWIVIIIIIAIIIVVFYYVGIPYLKGRAKRKNQENK